MHDTRIEHTRQQISQGVKIFHLHAMLIVPVKQPSRQNVKWL